MQLTNILFYLALGVATQARPVYEGRDDVSKFDDIILFDAPAFPDPANPGNTLASLQSYVFLRQIDFGVLSNGFSQALSLAGINVGNSLNILQDRIKLFGSIGVSGKSTEVDVAGCDQTVATGDSAFVDLGLSLATVSLGNCGTDKELSAESDLEAFVIPRSSQATIFQSPDSGFGVISDIDDTVKVSHVLDKVALLKTTFLEDPTPVTGMPDLYASLAQSLDNPQFVYVSGSPLQLYPFLHDFIDTTYSASKGPIMMQNLSITNPAAALQFVTNGNLNTQAFKLTQIDLLASQYPNKKWLLIGDSTQRDPEVYGATINKHGDSIACAWIRRVDQANNTDARFAAAFAGVPASRFRIYNDTDIPGLANIDVAGGKC